MVMSHNEEPTWTSVTVNPGSDFALGQGGLAHTRSGITSFLVIETHSPSRDRVIEAGPGRLQSTG